MTDLTREQIEAQLADWQDRSDVQAVAQRAGMAPDLARQLLATMTERDEAQAAQALVVERACLAVSEQADWPEDEHGRTEQPELFARVINAIRAAKGATP